MPWKRDNPGCACCQDASCNNCNIPLVDVVPNPTMTRYPLTALVTMENHIYEQRPTSICTDDCGGCASWDGIYACSGIVYGVLGVGLSQHGWVLYDEFTQATGELFAGGRRFDSTPCYSPEGTVYRQNFPARIRGGGCTSIQNQQMLLAVRVQFLSQTTAQVVVARDVAISWRSEIIPVVRLSNPCGNWNVTALPEVVQCYVAPGSLTHFLGNCLDPVVPGVFYDLSTCRYPQSVSVTFTDWVERPLATTA